MQSLPRTSASSTHDIHVRAAEWFEQHAEPVRAVQHAAAADDWARAADVMVRTRLLVDVLLETPTGQGLASALAAMPDLDDADIQLVRAALRLTCGDPTGAHEALSRGVEARAADPDRLIMRSAVAMKLHEATGDRPAARAAAAHASVLLAGCDGFTDPGGRRLVAFVSSMHGIELVRVGDLVAARAELTTAYESATMCGADDVRVRSAGWLALSEAGRGRLARSSRHSATVEQIGGGDRTAAYLAEVWVAVERQDLARAQHLLGRVTRCLEPQSDDLLASVSSLLHARLMRDRGDVAGARRVLQRTPAQTGWPGRLVDAERAAVGLARLGDEAAESNPSREVSTSEAVTRLLTRAQTALEQHDADRARADISRALSTARPDRVRRPFAYMSAQIRATIRRDPDLLARTGWLRSDSTVTRPGADRAATPIGEPLSERELEVLQHLASLLTTEEIAAEMFISVNTVKTHVRRILSKLAVSRRNDAVRRARDLGLVQPLSA